MGTDWTRVTATPRNLLTAGEIGLETPEKAEPGAWFLGPTGENVDRMRGLLDKALHLHAKARRDFARGDPPFISDETIESEAFTKTFDKMAGNLEALCAALRSSTPMASYRNKSHMNWDITMPGALGYFAAMMFNPNNVAPEASPVTTGLELEVGRDLSRMLGFGAPGEPRPWGHITCDGSIANTEAMWAARNLRTRAASLARAIRLEPEAVPKAARELSVRTAQGDFRRLLDLEPWDLVNLPNDVILELPDLLIEGCGADPAIVKRFLDDYGVQGLGLAGLERDVLQGLSPGVVIAPATAHYSWDKGVALLGLGAKALCHVPVDLDARLSIPGLRDALDRCIEDRVPVMQVVAVVGSTAESAVDPVADIVALRDEYAARGLTFALHADAAWGGYFTSRLRVPEKPPFTLIPSDPVSPYVKAQLDALRHCDTITLDPHKSGYLPYPAGSLCYRDDRMIRLVAHEAPVVYHGEVASAGVYGIEGSKPGAAAAGTALSHATIPLDQSGYGELLGRCIFNAKRFYIGVMNLDRKDDPFFPVPVARLPSDRPDPPVPDPADERRMFAEMDGIRNDELRALFDADKSGRLEMLFNRVGPDLTVFAYAFNFLDADGKPNDRVERMNDLNERIFRKLSVEKVVIHDQPPPIPMVVTSTLLQPATYGTPFTADYCRRAKVEVPDGPIRVLISTMQDPWVSELGDKSNFIPVLMGILRDTVLEARNEVLGKGA